MSPECQAVWWSHAWGAPEPCRNPAHETIDGVHLCWTHYVTVDAKLATLAEVVKGERGVTEDLYWDERFA